MVYWCPQFNEEGSNKITPSSLNRVGVFGEPPQSKKARIRSCPTWIPRGQSGGWH